MEPHHGYYVNPDAVALCMYQWATLYVHWYTPTPLVTTATAKYFFLQYHNIVINTLTHDAFYWTVSEYNNIAIAIDLSL